MLRFPRRTAALKSLCSILVIVLLLAPVGFLLAQRATAAQLAPRSLTLSSAMEADHNVTYKVTAGIPTTATVGSIRIQICSNTSLVDDSCVAPFGFDALNATLSGQVGISGFALSTSSTVNELVLTRPPTVQPPTVAAFTLTNITNPSNAGSNYARVLTYSSSDGTGPYIDAGGLAFAIDPSLALSAEVPPYLIFCVGENITGFDCATATEAFSDLGELSPALTSATQTQMLVATNASNGYSAWVTGSSMTSGNNALGAMAGGTAQKGTPQFGLNLRANTNPVIGQEPSGPGAGAVVAPYAQQNHFRYASGDTLVTSALPDDFRKYTISYIVNIAANQPGGVYSTTLTYVCLANF